MLFFVKQRLWLGLLLAMFLNALDTMVTIALLPTLLREYAGISIYAWILNAYLLASVIVAPVVGALFDRWGPQKSFRWAWVLVVFGALGASISQSIGQLVLARILQGFGGGFLMTLCYGTVAKAWESSEYPRRDAMMSVSWVLASLSAPWIASLLLGIGSWRWVYVMMAAVACVIALILDSTLDKEKSEGDGETLPGVKFCAGGALLMMGLLFPQGALPYFGQLALILIGGSLLLGGGKEEYSSLFYLEKKNYFSLLLSTGLAMWATGILYCLTAYLPLYVEGVLGLPAAEGGKVVCWISFGWLLGASINGWILSKGEWRWAFMSAVGSMFVGLSGLLWIVTEGRSSLWQMQAFVLLVGAGIGAVLNGNLVMGQNQSSQQHMGRMISLIHLVRGIGASLGLCLGSWMQVKLFQWNLAAATLSGRENELSQWKLHPELIFDAASRQGVSKPLLSVITASLQYSIQWSIVALSICALLALFISTRIAEKRRELQTSLS